MALLRAVIGASALVHAEMTRSLQGRQDGWVQLLVRYAS